MDCLHLGFARDRTAVVTPWDASPRIRIKLKLHNIQCFHSRGLRPCTPRGPNGSKENHWEFGGALVPTGASERVHNDEKLICLQVRGGARFVPFDAVVCILARDDYTQVMLTDGSSELVSVSMQP
jgi:hypothetical protein